MKISEICVQKALSDRLLGAISESLIFSENPKHKTTPSLEDGVVLGCLALLLTPESRKRRLPTDLNAKN